MVLVVMMGLEEANDGGIGVGGGDVCNDHDFHESSSAGDDHV